MPQIFFTPRAHVDHIYVRTWSEKKICGMTVTGHRKEVFLPVADEYQQQCCGNDDKENDDTNNHCN